MKASSPPPLNFYAGPGYMSLRLKKNRLIEIELFVESSSTQSHSIADGAPILGMEMQLEYRHPRNISPLSFGCWSDEYGQGPRRVDVAVYNTLFQ